MVRHECAPYGSRAEARPTAGAGWRVVESRGGDRDAAWGAVDSPGSPCISPPVPEAIPGLFIGVGGPREGMPVGPQGQRTTPFDNIEGDQR